MKRTLKLTKQDTYSTGDTVGIRTMGILNLYTILDKHTDREGITRYIISVDSPYHRMEHVASDFEGVASYEEKEHNN